MCDSGRQWGGARGRAGAEAAWSDPENLRACWHLGILSSVGLLLPHSSPRSSSLPQLVMNFSAPSNVKCSPEPLPASPSFCFQRQASEILQSYLKSRCHVSLSNKPRKPRHSNEGHLWAQPSLYPDVNQPTGSSDWLRSC